MVCPADRAGGVGSISQRLHRLGDDGPIDGGVGAIGGAGRDAEAGAIGKLANHGLRHGNFRVIELRLVLEHGDGEGVHRVRQMRSGSEGVVSAT